MSTGYLVFHQWWERQTQSKIFFLVQESHPLFCWLKRERKARTAQGMWITCCSRENQPAHPASWLYLNPSDFCIANAKSSLLYMEWKIRILSTSIDSCFFSNNWQIMVLPQMFLARMGAVFPDFSACWSLVLSITESTWMWFHHFPGCLLHISVSVVVTGHLIVWNVLASLKARKQFKSTSCSSDFSIFMHVLNNNAI